MLDSRRNGGDNNEQDTEDLNRVIDQLGLIELLVMDILYTWSSMRVNPPITCKIGQGPCVGRMGKKIPKG